MYRNSEPAASFSVTSAPAALADPESAPTHPAPDTSKPTAGAVPAIALLSLADQPAALAIAAAESEGSATCKAPHERATRKGLSK
eukprot:363847-Chlamydomonas_euryale.AAC.9